MNGDYPAMKIIQSKETLLIIAG